MAASSNKVVDIPPIIVLDVSSVFNFKGFRSSCTSRIIDYEVARLDEGTVKGTCFTKEDHSLILSNLYGSGSRAHSIMRQLNDYRRFIIRGLHHSIPISSIRAEFEYLNFTLCHIRNLKFYRNHEPMNLFEIAVAPFDLERNDEFLAIKKLCNRPVTIERQRQSDEPTMCQRCQRYGHTKNYCRRDPVCVICAGPHHKADCALPWTSPPKCANCGGKHVATYKGCIKFMEAKESLSQGPTNSSAQRHLSTSPSQQCKSPPTTSHRALNLLKPLPSPTKRDPHHSKPPRRAPSPARDDLSDSSCDSCTTNRPSRLHTTSSRRVLSPSPA
ncbi:uncharacterized protein [Drosophila bipectinata]|uniref:uncharacterized protein n=1 Tax=Drosophila bipectinata TaxID=42026 RepID=UPI001C8AD371|nr:uncharacterized protein LOC122321968 [Drosophila bipectinata]